MQERLKEPISPREEPSPPRANGAGPTSKVTKTTLWMSIMSLVIFLYEGFVYNVIFLWRILPAVGKRQLVVPFMVLFNTFWGLAMLSYFQARTSDPGAIPERWYDFVRSVGDALPIVPSRHAWQPGRATYCEKCSMPRPERAHHCLTCDICVLRMDHHCPWINNCVGFYNRKFFIQLLSYVYLSLIFVVVFTCVSPFFFLVWFVMHNPTASIPKLISCVVISMSTIVALLLIGTLTNFIRFHMKLVFENYTTIENLEREEGAKSKFDIGRRRNWEQVFGSNAWMWWLPMHTQVSRPIGDGVRWRVHYTRVIDEDEELPGDDDGAQARLLQQ
mmetsp:Transcript_126577/g.357987  ORF Transcript_126577/g.357987 Transcript_126577/m.357987 type:complete len:331 (-) Transcript_126577:130-1122(-)